MEELVRIGPYFKNASASTRLVVIQTAEDSSDRTHHDQYSEVDDDVEICLDFNLRSFGGRVTTIQHDFGVGPSEDDKTDDPRGIPNGTAAEEELVDCYGLLSLFTSRNVVIPQNPVIKVKVLMWRFGVKNE